MFRLLEKHGANLERARRTMKVGTNMNKFEHIQPSTAARQSDDFGAGQRKRHTHKENKMYIQLPSILSRSFLTCTVHDSAIPLECAVLQWF